MHTQAVMHMQAVLALASQETHGTVNWEFYDTS